MASEAMCDDGVRFRVQKGSSFDFECGSSGAWQNPKLRNLFTRIDELEALQIEHVVISKRLELGDVDRMVAHCRQHAGVATLANGYLLLLTPIPGWDNYLRCFAIKSKANGVDTESVASFSLMHLEEGATATSKDDGSQPTTALQHNDDAVSHV